MGERNWIAFDAADTLFEPTERVEDIYADCFAAYGFEVRAITWKQAIREGYQRMTDPVYPASGSGEKVEKDWWRELVHKVIAAIGEQPDADALEGAFEEIFDYYATGAAWQLYPETEAVLDEMKAAGCGLGIVSNFDYRLHRVLEELGISTSFDFVLTSADVRARKPDPALLHGFLKKAGTSVARSCLVGDNPRLDGGAAEKCGMSFFHVKRPERNLRDFLNWHQANY